MGQAPAGGIHYRFAVLGGANGLPGDTIHYFAGVEGGVVGERFGGLGVAQIGRGDGVLSFFLGLGPAVRLLRRDRLELLAFAGPGVYGEVDASGTRRWSGVGVGGLSARIPVSRILLALNLSGWTGRFRGDGFERTVDVAGVRLGMGLGWGWESRP
jgi:hypothetical protein